MMYTCMVYFCFLSSNSVARAHTTKYEKVEYLEFELQPMHQLCNVPTN